MAQDKPELPSVRVVAKGPSVELGVAAERQAREQAIKQLLRENRMSPTDQAALDDHLDRARSRSMQWKLIAAAIIGVVLLVRALI